MENENFKQIFGVDPEYKGSAFARANLIGEHTDYNNGFVLPYTLPRKITTYLAINDKILDGTVRLVSSLYPNEVRVRDITNKKIGDWSDYVIGSIQSALYETKISIKGGLLIYIESDITIGAGVSSSGALEVATIKALRSSYDLFMDDFRVALLGRRAENEYIGMPCGIMDQFTSAVGKNGYAYMLDCANLSYSEVKLPDTCDFVVMSSGIEHKLVNSEYNLRVKQCKEACSLLGIDSLRELSISEIDKLDSLPDVIRRRALHVITENQRVLNAYKALGKSDIDNLARIILDGHASQRDNYEITIPETDEMVESAVGFGALAARQIGGGFGGSLVVLLPKGIKDFWWEKMYAKYPKIFLV